MRAPERGALPLRLAATMGRAYGQVTEAVHSLNDADFARPTRCPGMAVGPLLVHLLYDAQRALTAFASPTTAQPDRDFVTYWHDFPPRAEGAPEPDTTFEQKIASAYRKPALLVQHWKELSEAAVRAAAAGLAEKGRRIETQGHVLPATDFVATLVLEATVHHLDLTVGLPTAARRGRPGHARPVRRPGPAARLSSRKHPQRGRRGRSNRGWRARTPSAGRRPESPAGGPDRVPCRWQRPCTRPGARCRTIRRARRAKR